MASSLERLAQRSCEVSERWTPDAYVFAVLATLVIAALAMIGGASPIAAATAFGSGYWSLIPFTMHYPSMVQRRG
jgi:short-chain fatty acids transporter